jgi:hypothetical protein
MFVIECERFSMRREEGKRRGDMAVKGLTEAEAENKILHPASSR